MDTSALAGRRFAALLLDLDGTLIDSTAAVERSWHRWAGEYGLPGRRPDGSTGVPARQIVAGLLPADQLEAGLARIEQIECEDVEGIPLLPGAEALLAALPAGRAAIVTSCTRPLAEARIAATGLARPGVLVTADEVPVGKPDPAPYRLAARRLGVDPRTCLVVEDAPAGLIAARAAGSATLAVSTTHPAGELADLADAVVASLAQVRAEPGEGGGLAVRISS